MKPMHFAMALLSAAMFFVGGRLYGRPVRAGRHEAGGGYRPRHPLAVGVYRHRCGVPVPAAASAVPEDAEKRLRAEIRPAGDRRYNRETEAVPCGAAGGCRGVAVYGIARDGGYCHPDHDLRDSGAGSERGGGAVWPAGAGLRRVLRHRRVHLRAAEPLLRPRLLDLSAACGAGLCRGGLPARLPGAAPAR